MKQIAGVTHIKEILSQKNRIGAEFLKGDFNLDHNNTYNYNVRKRNPEKFGRFRTILML